MRSEFRRLMVVERTHYWECEEERCPRCADWVRYVAREQQRAVNFVFSTLWAAAGLGSVIWLVFRVFGR